MARALSIILVLAYVFTVGYFWLGRGSFWNVPLGAAAVIGADIVFLLIPLLALGAWAFIKIKSASHGLLIGGSVGFLAGRLISITSPKIAPSFIAAVLFGLAGWLIGKRLSSAVPSN